MMWMQHTAVIARSMLQTNTVAISLLFGMDNEGYLFSAYTGLACEWCRAPNGKDGNM